MWLVCRVAIACWIDGFHFHGNIVQYFSLNRKFFCIVEAKSSEYCLSHRGLFSAEFIIPVLPWPSALIIPVEWRINWNVSEFFRRCC